MSKTKKPSLLERIKRIWIKPNKDSVVVGVKIKF